MSRIDPRHDPERLLLPPDLRTGSPRATGTTHQRHGPVERERDWKLQLGVFAPFA
jgi:hypothetical protein